MCPKINYTLVEGHKKLVASSEEHTRSLIKVSPSTLDAGHDIVFDSTDFSSFKSSRITEIIRLPTTWRTVFKVKFEDEIDYEPCDSIGLLVPNPDDIVDRVMAQCGFENSRIKIERTGAGGFIFDGLLRDFIKFKMDLDTIPRKRLILELARKAAKKNELEYLCSPEGTNDYMRLGARMNTLADILEEFGCRPSIEELLVYCEILKPRYYSLIQASGQAEILLGVISNCVDGCEMLGHVSRFVTAEYESGTAPYSIPVEYVLRKSALFHGFTSRNIICFCTGTGVAPCISFYRRYLLSGCIDGLRLVYGFRSDEDNLLNYYDMKCDVILAKSSDKSYVYDFVDVIKEYNGDCNVFICGNMNMQRSVFMAIKSKFAQLIEEKKVYFDNWS